MVALAEMSSNGVCYPEQECWRLRLQNLPNFQDKLEIQTLKKIHGLNIFYMLAETVFRTLGGWGEGQQTKQVCVPDVALGPPVCNFCRNILFGVTQYTWLCLSI